ncbi:hypothetical protein NTD86_03865 [Pseudomonas sp. 7P_10.2_Bac1]|uniref:dimethylamine monooxygenase subunit DmmA family protein n=1 Tax=Pseudomonas sp. 7P_10.2_Bac1 TaxID=2971614 RepID=UPI0021C7C7F5|nr:dimethylamine monooxygenase subunit DmmA family protein [Pseudomonas sp. 7P_10.2_Bac1]MCU1726124.1 hypothetical protein [Pseudomonas sp. 7P_10.2_Bac1]
MTDTLNAAPEHRPSLPRYRTALPRANARQHIVVMQCAAACAPFVGELDQPQVLNGENPDFARRLEKLLSSATVGSQLYLMGDEAFMWRIHGQARNAGLEEQEINLAPPLAGPRQVYCVHCGLIQAACDTAQLTCIGCEVDLEIREHFSHRLGAYIGVCRNPDQPYAGAQS